METLSAISLKQMLLDIYRCRRPFELLLIDKKPKTKMGVYIVNKQRIRICSGWGKFCPLKEIAIHEYAHHIHETSRETQK